MGRFKDKSEMTSMTTKKMKDGKLRNGVKYEPFVSSRSKCVVKEARKLFLSLVGFCFLLTPALPLHILLSFLLSATPRNVCIILFFFITL